MKVFFKVLSNMDIMNFIILLIPLPFLLGAFVCAYDLIFNDVVKRGVCIDTLLLLLSISALLYFVFGMMFRIDYKETKSELNK